MNLFKSVFADERTPPESPHPEDNQSESSTWTFGGLLKSIATKSDSVIETYRRDFQELSSGIKKESAVIRDVASRSFDSGASVAQHSLESVGQAFDDIASIVFKSTAQIVSPQGNDNRIRTDALNLDVKRYSRFENQVRVLQCDVNTYSNVPEDEIELDKWRLERFVLDEKREEIERILRENGVVREIYDEIVPNLVDSEGFWSRYFYRVFKLKQAEEARELLVKRAISAEDEEDLSWDIDDDEEDGGENSRNVGNIEGEARRDGVVTENNGEMSGVAAVEGKGENGECHKVSDVSVVSSQSVPELGWDQIEDVESDDEMKRQAGGSGKSVSRVDIRKTLSSAEEEEDLSWDIEDEDDDSIKP